MRKNVKKLTASALLLALLFGTNPLFAAQSISELKNKQSDINSSIESNKKKLEATSDKKIKTLDDLKAINQNIASTKQTINKLTNDISAKEKEIVVLEDKIKESQAKLERKITEYNKRLVEVYKEGDVKYLDVLFGAEDFNDFLTRYQYIQYINDSDEDLMKEVKEQKAKLQDQQTQVANVKKTLESNRQAKENRKNELAQLGENKQALVTELTSQEKEIQKNIQSMEQASNEIGAQIQAIQAQQAAAAAAAAAAANQGSGSTGSGGAGYDGAYVPANGVLTFPVPSYYGVTSEYGWRGDPFSGGQSFHMGIDLGASMGAPVLAAGDGRIILQEYHWSYGNYVVIDHGNGLSTVYAHMSAFTKPFGSVVKAGEQIGAIGTTGASTGPHLHFEVRVNGQHTQPRGYLGM